MGVTLQEVNESDLKGRPYKLNRILKQVAELLSRLRGEAGAFRFDVGPFTFAGQVTFQGKATLAQAEVADLRMPNQKIFADNAAALTGGLVPDQTYRTATGQLMVVFKP
jgi:hypothetical protein